jgi:hypothetical protein
MTPNPPPLSTAIAADLHPYAPPGRGGPSPVSALRVGCSVLPDGDLRLAYTLEGRMDALRLPTQSGPDAWPLWRHTCFEAFLAIPGEAGYREYNFSPAGLWAASAFRRYREIEREIGHGLAGDTTGDMQPTIQTERRGAALLLTVRLPLALLPNQVELGAESGPVLRVGLSAVIERMDGQLEYWALHHPVAERADFHHQDGWTLRLATGRARP